MKVYAVMVTRLCLPEREESTEVCGFVNNKDHAEIMAREGNKRLRGKRDGYPRYWVQPYETSSGLKKLDAVDALKILAAPEYSIEPCRDVISECECRRVTCRHKRGKCINPHGFRVTVYEESSRFLCKPCTERFASEWQMHIVD